MKFGDVRILKGSARGLRLDIPKDEHVKSVYQALSPSPQGHYIFYGTSDIFALQ